MEADAQGRRAPLERAADRYARLFLPAVLTATETAMVPIAKLWGTMKVKPWDPPHRPSSCGLKGRGRPID